MRYPLLFALFGSLIGFAGVAGALERSGATTLTPKATSEHFGAQLVLTTDEAVFKRHWIAAAGDPKDYTVDAVHRGASISAVLIFQGCQPDLQGKCDVVADFSVLAPSGTLIPGGSASLWSEAPVPGGLHLGNGSMGVTFDEADPAGHYRIQATVYDRISGKRLSLSSPLDVQ